MFNPNRVGCVEQSPLKGTPMLKDMYVNQKGLVTISNPITASQRPPP